MESGEESEEGIETNTERRRRRRRKSAAALST
jgi:hypothetical protein